MEAEITLSYEDERKAEAVAEAVSPDNVEVPLGLFVRTARKGFRVFTRVRCETRLRTFVSTIDDLLCCVSVAEKAFSVAKGFEAHPNQSPKEPSSSGVTLSETEP